jgi:hypothetical protein
MTHEILKVEFDSVTGLTDVAINVKQCRIEDFTDDFIKTLCKCIAESLKSARREMRKTNAG